MYTAPAALTLYFVITPASRSSRASGSSAHRHARGSTSTPTSAYQPKQKKPKRVRNTATAPGQSSCACRSSGPRTATRSGTEPVRLGDTIVAIATGFGSSRRAMIRLSGPDAFNAVDRLLDEPPPVPRGVRRATMLIPARTTRTSRPGGSTSSWPPSPRRALTPAKTPARSSCPEPAADASRARPAPGQRRRALADPASSVAFLNGRMTAEQAEGVRAMIAARPRASTGCTAAPRGRNRSPVPRHR